MIYDQASVKSSSLREKSRPTSTSNMSTMMVVSSSVRMVKKGADVRVAFGRRIQPNIACSVFLHDCCPLAQTIRGHGPQLSETGNDCRTCTKRSHSSLKLGSDLLKQGIFRLIADLIDQAVNGCLSLRS